MADDLKIPLPKYLKILTDNGVPVKKSMELAQTLYKKFNTPAQLKKLNDLELKFHKITEEDRKLLLPALQKAGYSSEQSTAGPSRLTRPVSAMEAVTTPPKKRRKCDDTNELLPGPADEASKYGSMDFKEVLDEEKLRSRTAIINRAPTMSAWAMIVAERQGFHREEALSIASVYTEMNALARGVTLGIYKEGQQKGVEASRSGTQPYVELMGRRPLYQSQTNQWRAILNGTPALPNVAFSYISRSLRQTAPFVIGAMRLLAESYSPSELNHQGFELYAEFRPKVTSWGERAELKCESILSLRKKRVVVTTNAGEDIGDTASHTNVPEASPDDDSEGPPDRSRRIIYEKTQNQSDSQPV